MIFANPWGLLGLLALPAIVVLHLYHRRYPPLLIGGLHLWGLEPELRQPGRRRERLPITASLLLELLAATVLSLLLAHPKWDENSAATHLVIVLDQSASMQARPPGEPSFREAAIAEANRRLAALPKKSVATVFVTGRRPAMLTTPATDLSQAQAALDHWNPTSPAHDFEPAWDLASQLAGEGGRILFLTDHLPPKTTAVPKNMEIFSVGRPLENTAITAARWSFDAKKNRGRVFVRIANLGHRSTDVKIHGSRGAQKLFEQTLPLQPGSDSALESEVPGGLGDLTVEIASPADGLAIDNRVMLIEPRVRTVTIALALLENHSARRPVQRALAGIADVQFGSPAAAQLMVGPAAELPSSRSELWWLGIGPIDLAPAARKQAKDIVGPFVLEKRHPLLDGVVLGGVIFGGVQPVKFEESPLVTAGQQLLLGRLTGTRATAYLLNLDFARSNLGDSPDWPILVKNLVELCRDSLPGLRRWNYRLNEEIAFRPEVGREGKPSGAEPLSLVFAGKSRPLPRSDVVEVPPLEETGVYEVRDGNRPVGRFSVNFYDPVESNLLALGPGIREAIEKSGPPGYRLDDPFSWLTAGCIAVLVAIVLADWCVLRNGRN